MDKTGQRTQGASGNIGTTETNGEPTVNDNNQPPQNQLTTILQQNPVREIGGNEPNEVNHGWNTPQNRIVFYVAVLIALGLYQTYRGAITGNDQLFFDGLSGTSRAVKYALLTILVLAAIEGRNRPDRRTQ